MRSESEDFPKELSWDTIELERITFFQAAINEKALEKDLWVTLVLRAVFKTK